MQSVEAIFMPVDGREELTQDGNRRLNPPRRVVEPMCLRTPNPYDVELGSQTVPVVKTSERRGKNLSATGQKEGVNTCGKAFVH